MCLTVPGVLISNHGRPTFIFSPAEGKATRSQNGCQGNSHSQNGCQDRNSQTPLERHQETADGKGASVLFPNICSRVGNQGWCVFPPALLLEPEALVEGRHSCLFCSLCRHWGMRRGVCWDNATGVPLGVFCLHAP